jgi:hypothetical protein
MTKELNRVESAVTATASGDLTWEHWTHDCATALGIAGQRNPLGFAVVRYLSSEPTAANAWNIVLHLATTLIEMGHPADVANGAAWKALDVWNNGRCMTCDGRSMVMVEDKVVPCPRCNGTGERDISHYTEVVRQGVYALVASASLMEGQLSARLKR